MTGQPYRLGETGSSFLLETEQASATVYNYSVSYSVRLETQCTLLLSLIQLISDDLKLESVI